MPMTRRVVVAAAAGACALAAPAAAHAVPLTVTPKAPSVKDALTIAFQPKTKLPKGQRYSALVTVDGTAGECTTVAAQTSTATGKSVRITVRSKDGNFTGTDAWCAGKATIVVRRGPASGGPSQVVGRTTVRLAG
jgi:hypothetical protein